MIDLLIFCLSSNIIKFKYDVKVKPGLFNLMQDLVKDGKFDNYDLARLLTFLKD